MEYLDKIKERRDAMNKAHDDYFDKWNKSTPADPAYSTYRTSMNEFHARKEELENVINLIEGKHAYYYH